VTIVNNAQGDLRDLVERIAEPGGAVTFAEELRVSAQYV